MAKQYRLFWLRQNACDSGTPTSLDDLDVSIRDRVAAATHNDGRVVPLHLPYLDAREWRGRAHVLRTLEFVREGDAIRGICRSPLGPLRDKAAWLRATHPAWLAAKRESDRHYFRSWQVISVGLQLSMRAWIRDLYFADLRNFRDRDASYAALIYSVSRPCFGRPSTEFTFDVANEEMLPAAMRMIGCATQAALATVEARLRECGMPALARRFSPIWYQDLINAVRAKPTKLVGLLGDEGMLINAVIHMGASNSLAGVKPFARTSSLAVRNVLGVKMSGLAFRALDETTRLLQESQKTEVSRPGRRSISRFQSAGSRPLSSEPSTCDRYMLGSAASR